MIERLPESAKNHLAYRISGKMTEADYRDQLGPDMEKAMKDCHKIRVLLIVEGFEGWTVGGAWEDLLLALKFPAVERMAMVIDESWDEWMTWLFQGFTTLTGTELRFFTKDRLPAAWEWIRA
jgi:hypothetical protein